MSILRSKRATGSNAVESITVTPYNTVYAGVEYAIGAGGVMYAAPDLRVVEYTGWADSQHKPLRNLGANVSSAMIAPYGQPIVMSQQVGCVSYNADLDLVFWGWVQNNSGVDNSGVACALYNKATGVRQSFAQFATGTGAYTATSHWVSVYILPNGSIAMAAAHPTTVTQVVTATIPVTSGVLGTPTLGPVAAVSNTANTGVAISPELPNKLVSNNTILDLSTFTTVTATESGMLSAGAFDGKYIVSVGTTTVRILDVSNNTAQTITLTTPVAAGRMYVLRSGIILHYASTTGAITILKITYGTTHTITQAAAGTVSWAPSFTAGAGPDRVVVPDPESDVFSFYDWFDITVTRTGVASALVRYSPLSQRIKSGCVGWLPTNLAPYIRLPWAVNTPVFGHFIATTQAPKSHVLSVTGQPMTQLQWQVNAHFAAKVVPALFLGELKAASFGSPASNAAGGVPVNFMAELQPYKGAFTKAYELNGSTLVLNSLRCVKLRQVSKAHSPTQLTVIAATGTDNAVVNSSPTGTYNSGKVGTLNFQGSDSDTVFRDRFSEAYSGHAAAYTPQQFNTIFAGEFDAAEGTGLNTYSIAWVWTSDVYDRSITVNCTIVDCLGLRMISRVCIWDASTSYGNGMAILYINVQQNGLCAMAVSPSNVSANQIHNILLSGPYYPGLTKLAAAGPFIKE